MSLIRKFLTVFSYFCAVAASAQADADSLPCIRMLDNECVPLYTLGAFHIGRGQEAERTLSSAVRHGYRSFDLAHAWNNAPNLGNAFRQSGLRRTDFWVSGSIWPKDIPAAGVVALVDSLLGQSGLEYFDLLYLVQTGDDQADQWREFQGLKDKGYAKSLGISNFDGDTELISRLIESGMAPDAVQAVRPPYAPMPEWNEWMVQHDVPVVYMLPLIGDALDMRMFEDPLVGAVANHHNKTTEQVVLRWHLQQPSAIVIGTCKREDLTSMMDLFDFELSPAEFEAVALVGSGIKPSPFLLQQLQKLIHGYLLFEY